MNVINGGRPDDGCEARELLPGRSSCEIDPVGPAVGEDIVNPGVGADADTGDVAVDVVTFNHGYIGRD